jgi:hypothetical protein
MEVRSWSNEPNGKDPIFDWGNHLDGITIPVPAVGSRVPFGADWIERGNQRGVYLEKKYLQPVYPFLMPNEYCPKGIGGRLPSA